MNKGSNTENSHENSLDGGGSAGRKTLQLAWEQPGPLEGRCPMFWKVPLRQGIWWAISGK